MTEQEYQELREEVRRKLEERGFELIPPFVLGRDFIAAAMGVQDVTCHVVRQSRRVRVRPPLRA